MNVSLEDFASFRCQLAPGRLFKIVPLLAAILVAPTALAQSDRAWASVDAEGRIEHSSLSWFSAPGISVERTGTGVYSVELPTSLGGNIQVQAAGALNNHCHLRNLRINNSGWTSFEVECWSQGVLRNTAFRLFFYREGRFDSQRNGAYVAFGSVSPGTAQNRFQWNSKGKDNTVERLGLGDYKVVLTDLAVPGGELIQLTAVDGRNFCAITSFNAEGPNEVVRLRCYDAFGAPSDSKFFLSFMTDLIAGGDPADPSTAGYTFNERGFITIGLSFPLNNSNVTSGNVSAVHTGPGLYRVEFTGLDNRHQDNQGTFSSYVALATAFSPLANTCNVNAVASDLLARKVTVTVSCFDRNAEPVNSLFSLLFVAHAPASVVFFQDTDFAGDSLFTNLRKSAREPFLGDQSKGLDWNDKISSLTVPAGLQVTLYEHSDYHGSCKTFTGRTPSLLTIPGTAKGNWNDSASSYVIAPIKPLSIAGPQTLPIGRVGTAYSAQFSVAGGSGGDSTWSVTPALPAGLTLSASGLLSGTPQQAIPNGSYTFKVTDCSNTQSTAILSLTIEAAATPLTITGSDFLPLAIVGVPFSFQFQAAGGVPPYKWSATQPLPAGLSLSATGLLSGTPQQTGSPVISIRLEDSSGTGTFRTKTYTLTVDPALKINGPTAVPTGTVGVPYSVQFTASGGVQPYTWTITAQPTGLSMSSSGLLSGTPQQAVSNRIATVSVKDAIGTVVSLTIVLTINAAPTNLTITGPTTLPNGTVGVPYSAQFTASGGTAPYTWSVSPNLPGGLTLNSNSGVLSGTPQSAINSSFTFTVRDSNNVTQTRILALTIDQAAGALLITTASLPAGGVGKPYGFVSLSATGGTPPYVWRVSPNLPNGMTLSAGGVLSGTPQSTFNSSLNFTVTDSNNGVQTKALSLTINPATVTLNAPAQATFGRPVTMTAGVPPGATGKVAFFNGVTMLGVAPVSAASAQFTTSLLPAGTARLRAYYLGDPAFAAASSANVTMNISAIPSDGFETGKTYNAVNGPSSIAVADFDGDGKPDLAVVESSTNEVSALVGNGDGTFQPPFAKFPVGQGPVSVAVGDFDADGTSDVAVANNLSNSVTVIWGAGPIIDTYPVGTKPTSVVVGDLSGDGKPDLVIAYPNGLSVLLGKGNGTFEAARNFPLPGSPASVALGDFTGDGNADLVVADSANSRVTVLLNNGDDIGAIRNYTTGAGPRHVVVGDFNRDGSADIAVAGSSTLSVLLGNGDGTHQAAQTYPAPIGSFLAVGDFNGDGTQDLSVSAAVSGEDRLLLGKGDGSFQTAPFNTGLSGSAFVAVADFNGDGRTDLAIPGLAGRISVLLGKAAGTLSIVGPLTLPVGAVGTVYGPVTFATSGGTGPYTWSALGLPDGISMSSAGVLSGTPLAGSQATYTPQFTVTDSRNASSKVSLLLVVNRGTGPNLLNFTYRIGDALPQSQTIPAISPCSGIGIGGGSVTTYTASLNPTVSWLEVLRGTCSLTVTLAPAGLAPGIYSTTLTIQVSVTAPGQIGSSTSIAYLVTAAILPGGSTGGDSYELGAFYQLQNEGSGGVLGVDGTGASSEWSLVDMSPDVNDFRQLWTIESDGQGNLLFTNARLGRTWAMDGAGTRPVMGPSDRGAAGQNWTTSGGRLNNRASGKSLSVLSLSTGQRVVSLSESGSSASQQWSVTRVKAIPQPSVLTASNFVRIYNRQRKEYLYENNGVAVVGSLGPDDQAGHWRVTLLPGTRTADAIVGITNRKSLGLVRSDAGTPNVGPAPVNARLAGWFLEPLQGDSTGWRLSNSWTYRSLSGETLPVSVGAVSAPDLAGAQWEFQIATDQPGAISITGVRSAAEFGGGFNTFASGSYIEIAGTGLADTTRIWRGADFEGNGQIAPTVLDNVRVTVNGIPAFIYYISPTQLNVHTPADPATGPVEIRVTVGPSGRTASITVQKVEVTPGMLAPASFRIGGRQYLVAQFSDFFYVGSAGLIPGFAFRPAKPGETVTAYGIGFGDVTPSTPPGTVVSRINQLVRPLSVAFGQVPAVVSYQGLAPSFVGLYQFNITVPANLPDGDYQINMTLGGQPLSQPAFFLTVQR